MRLDYIFLYFNPFKTVILLNVEHITKRRPYNWALAEIQILSSNGGPFRLPL